MNKKIYSKPTTIVIEVSCEKIIATSIGGSGEDSGGLNSNHYNYKSSHTGPFAKDKNGWPILD